MPDFDLVIMAHLLGDFFLQNDWMALNKKKRMLPCLVHCVIYSGTVALIVRPSWLMFLIAFISHYPIDRSNIITTWMRFYGLTTFETLNRIEDAEVRAARKLFLPLIYVGVDNSLHLLLLWAGLKLCVS